MEVCQSGRDQKEGWQCMSCELYPLGDSEISRLWTPGDKVQSFDLWAMTACGAVTLNVGAAKIW